jgi:hypothetical protein
MHVDNQEWTIQRHWQNWVDKTQNEDKQSKRTTQITKKIKKGNQNPQIEEKQTTQ